MSRRDVGHFYQVYYLQKVIIMIIAYMAELAMMVISQKKREFSPFFMSTMGIIQPHLKSFSDLSWIYRGKQVIICKNMIQKSLHSLSNQIQSFLNFKLTIFKMLYLINYQSFYLNSKSESWALVSAIQWHNMTRF